MHETIWELHMKISKDAFKPGVACFNNGISTTKARIGFWAKPNLWQFVPFLCVLWLSTLPLSALTLLSSNQLVFVNVDHAPMGALATITYGYKGDACGIGTFTGNFPYWNPSGGGGDGVLIALSNSSGLQLLPFVKSAASISTNAGYFPDSGIQRSLTPCTDEHTVVGAGLAFTHYTPAWPMADLNSATLHEQKRYFLPATWLVFTIQNTNSTPEDFYFGLPVAVTQKTFANGAYEGFTLGEAALAVPSGSCEVLSGARLSSVFNGMTQGFASLPFSLSVMEVSCIRKRSFSGSAGS